MHRVYYESTLRFEFNPDFTNLAETLIFHIKLVNKKYFFTYIEIHLPKIILNNENNDFTAELHKILNNRENSYNTFVIGDLNAHG